MPGSSPTPGGAPGSAVGVNAGWHGHGLLPSPSTLTARLCPGTSGRVMSLGYILGIVSVAHRHLSYSECKPDIIPKAAASGMCTVNRQRLSY